MMSVEIGFIVSRAGGHFMRLRVVVNSVVLSLVFLVSSVFSIGNPAEPSPADQLAVAVESWHVGDLNGAQGLLTQIIEAGTRDPRAYYYRALLSEQLGTDSEQDLRAAAKLEAETTSSRLVNRALENVQGATRAKIEKYRAEARAKLKSDPQAEAAKALYREGIVAYKAGDSLTALTKFEDAIKGNTEDPRMYYFRGITLADLGRMDEAKLAFSDGLTREKSAKDIQLVNLALTDVQGGVRQIIEQQTTAKINGELVSRQEAHRLIKRLSSMSQEERLAEANAAAAREAELEQAAAVARQQKAAEAILAENKARMEAEERLNAPVTPAKDLLAAADAPQKTDAAKGTPKTDTVPMAEAPVASGSSNPFLGGKAALPGLPAARANAGPIDTSYLPANADFVVYARPADILASGFVAPMKGTPDFEKGMTDMTAQIGFDANDIDSVTSGISNFIGGMMQMGMMAAGGQDPAAMAQNVFGGANAVSVLRTNKDIAIEDVIAASKGVEATFESKTYYLIENQQPNQPQVALYQVDASTFVFGVEKAVQNVITNGAGEATNEQFSFVSNASPLVMAFAGPLLPGMSGSIPEAPQGSAPFARKIFDAVRGKISGAAIVMDFGSNLDLKIVVNLTEPEAATEVQAPLNEAAATAKQFYPIAGAGSVPEPLKVPVQQLVDSLSASHSGSAVTISLRAPGQIVTIIKDNPTMFQGMLPAGPPGFPGQGPGPVGPPRTLPAPPQP